MIPKDKAEELIYKMQSISGLTRFAKIYAMVAVDEILYFMKLVDEDSGTCYNTNSK